MPANNSAECAEAPEAKGNVSSLEKRNSDADLKGHKPKGLTQHSSSYERTNVHGHEYASSSLKIQYLPVGIRSLSVDFRFLQVDFGLEADVT